MGNFGKNFMLWLIIAGALFLVFNMMSGSGSPDKEVAFSELLQEAKDGRIKSVKIYSDERRLEGVYANGTEFKTNIPREHEKLAERLAENGVLVDVSEVNTSGRFWRGLLISALPILLLVGLFIYFMRQMQGGGKGGALSFGRSRAKLMNEDDIRVTFDDVAGVDEAKEEVTELVDFLRDPSKFQKLGGRIPRGVLMVGSPGTGKTLLAKAIAGEAKVPFFSISGSDFVEMFVGVGASRVRDMFEQARKNAPCIIFIDEIDAVGRHRGAGMGGGHDEREQTLNQLLVEMDGFDGGEGVIVIAATNRPDVLDPALLRPGRFDRQVMVPLPDIRGREQIIKVHMAKVPVSENVNAAVMARGTPGFSGADLANLVNEAALFAARSNKRMVEAEDFDKARDKIMMGPERKTMVMDEEEKLLTSYHEAGHTIVGKLTPGDPVYKVTIIPRGRALGVTHYLPEKDRYGYTREYCHARLASAMGGRAAEELIYGADKVTSGASGDIQAATQMARQMVESWGLSDTMGPIQYADGNDQVFLGKGYAQERHISDETASQVDKEVRSLVEQGLGKAHQLLEDNVDRLHAMAEALMKYETLDAGQVEEIMNDQDPTPPDGWSDGSSGGGKPTMRKTVESDQATVESKPNPRPDINPKPV